MYIQLPIEELREAFDCDPSTGILRWKATGKLCGQRTDSYGYLVTKIHRKRLLQHRVVWAIATGDWPKKGLDHINGIRTDNRVANLREANNSQNQMNRGAQVNNSVGFKGVFKQGNRWRSHIWANEKHVYLGYFDTKEQAHTAYCEAAKRFHGEFANTGG